MMSRVDVAASAASSWRATAAPYSGVSSGPVTKSPAAPNLRAPAT
jgi:hypothetical protein